VNGGMDGSIQVWRGSFYDNNGHKLGIRTRSGSRVDPPPDIAWAGAIIITLVAAARKQVPRGLEAQP
jgi:hypothetical protein